MDTKNIKLKGGENKKAGKDTTQTILTATGAAVVGAIGGAAVASSAQEAELPIASYEDEPTEQTQTEGNVQVEDQQPETETEQGSDQPVADDNGTSGDITQPQPTDGGHENNPSQPQQQPEGNTGNGGSTGGQTPEEIAQDIIGKEEIDLEDIDTPSVFTVDGFTTVYDEMGNEVDAATIHTSDGTQFLLADKDGDGVFEGVYDNGGNFVAMAESNITQSDLQTMFDPTGGYLAANDLNMPEGPSADPTNDIINTETGEHVNPANYFAENNLSNNNENTTPEIPEDIEDIEGVEDVDDLLAQLLEDETDENNEPNAMGLDLIDDDGIDEV